MSNIFYIWSIYISDQVALFLHDKKIQNLFEKFLKDKMRKLVKLISDSSDIN